MSTGFVPDMNEEKPKQKSSAKGIGLNWKAGRRKVPFYAGSSWLKVWLKFEICYGEREYNKT